MMSTRYERRKARKEVRAKLRDYRVRRILADEVGRGGAGTETYSVRHDQTGEIIHFNISAMRPWAETHVQRVGAPPNFEIAAKLIDDLTVDPKHIAEHTLKTQPEPILICRDVFGGDQIVDGSHRFVAFCAGCATWELKDAYFPAYVLERPDWEQFVIPRAVARSCGFEQPYEAWIEEKSSVTE